MATRRSDDRDQAGGAQLVRRTCRTRIPIIARRSASSIATVTGAGSCSPNAAHTPPDALAPDGERRLLPRSRRISLSSELLEPGAGAHGGRRDADCGARSDCRRRPHAVPAAAWRPLGSDQQKRLLAAMLGDTPIDRLGMGSEEIDQLLRKQLQQNVCTVNPRAGSRSRCWKWRRVAESFQRIRWISGGHRCELERATVQRPGRARLLHARECRDHLLRRHASGCDRDGERREDPAHPRRHVPLPLHPAGWGFRDPGGGDFARRAGAALRHALLQTRHRASGDVGSTGQPQELDPLIGKV